MVLRAQIPTSHVENSVSSITILVSSQHESPSYASENGAVQ